MDFDNVMQSGMRPGLISAAAFHSLGGAPIPESWFPTGRAWSHGASPFQMPKPRHAVGGSVPVERPTMARESGTVSLSVDPDQIAEELALCRYATVDALAALRRRFALHNHPDRMSLDQRGRATTRMSIANAMIDKAMDDLRRRHRHS